MWQKWFTWLFPDHTVLCKTDWWEIGSHQLSTMSNFDSFGGQSHYCMHWRQRECKLSFTQETFNNLQSLCMQESYMFIHRSSLQCCTHTQTMLQERAGQLRSISWAAAVSVSGLAVTPHHPVCKANRRMPSSRQGTINAQGHHAEVKQLWPCSALTRPLMFLCTVVHICDHACTHTIHTNIQNIQTVCSSSAYKGRQSSALVRRRSKRETE